MSQIGLPFDSLAVAEDDGYIVTDANRAAHEHIQNARNWPNLTAILVGPPASGKTAMARQFISDCGGKVVDDAATTYDDMLFHLWNRCQLEKRPLLLVSRYPVSRWNIALPDLQSRLAAAQLVTIGDPDDGMIDGLLQKYFAARGLSISPEAVAYLSKRMERTYQNIQLLARTMDKLAIERKKPITRAIAISALEDVDSRPESGQTHERQEG